MTHSPAPGAAMAASDELPRAEQVLRRLLAYRIAGALLYADDGELQDNTARPWIDFRRDSVDAIEEKLGERTRALAASVPAQVSAQPVAQCAYPKCQSTGGCNGPCATPATSAVSSDAGERDMISREWMERAHTFFLEGMKSIDLGDGSKGWIEHDVDGVLKRDSFSLEGEIVFGFERIKTRIEELQAALTAHAGAQTEEENADKLATLAAHFRAGTMPSDIYWNIKVTAEAMRRVFAVAAGAQDQVVRDAPTVAVPAAVAGLGVSNA